MYDKQAKRELVRRCQQPGVSVAALALAHGLNANLLRKWITMSGRRRSGEDERAPMMLPVTMQRPMPQRRPPVDLLQHPNQQRYPGQKISVVLIESYAYLVPFVESEIELFLRQSFRAARPPDSTWVNPMNKLDADEKEILEAFESGKLKPVKNRSRELARHRKVAEATFTKDSRINIRISSKDLRALQKRALAEGLPYQTLVSSVLHKFVEGQMVEQPADKGVRQPR